MSAERAQAFEDLIEVTDVATAFWSLRCSYPTFAKSLRRQGRTDLLQKLDEWRAKDVERQREARGQWE